MYSRMFDPEELAMKLDISYSWFFAKYLRIIPATLLQNISKS